MSRPEQPRRAGDLAQGWNCVYPVWGTANVLAISAPPASSQVRRSSWSEAGTANAAYFLPSTTRGVTSWVDPSDRSALRWAVAGLTWRAYPVGAVIFAGG